MAVARAWSENSVLIVTQQLKKIWGRARTALHLSHGNHGSVHGLKFRTYILEGKKRSLLYIVC